MTDENPYTSVVNDMYDNVAVKETNLRQSMIQGSQLNPDEAAKALPVAEKAQLPLDMTARNLPEMTKNFNVDGLDYAGMLKAYPKLSNFLSNPDNAAVSHDDIPALQKASSFFSNASKYGGFVNAAMMSANPDFIRSVASGVASGVGTTFTGLGATASRASEGIINGLANPQPSRQWAAQGFVDTAPPGEVTTKVGQTIAGALTTAGDAMSYIGDQYKPLADELSPNKPTTLNQVGETVGQFLPWIAATLATGGEAAMPALFGGSAFGSKLEQEKTDVVGPSGPQLSPYGTTKGDLAAGLYGAVNAILGTKTFGAITHVIPPSVEKNVLLPIVEGLNKVGIPVGGTAEQWITKALDTAYRGVTGGAQMAAIQATGNVTDKFLLGHTDKDLTEGVASQFGVAGSASAILGALFHTIAHTPTMFDEARAKAAKDYFDKSREVLSESNLMKRSPEKMNDLINSQTGGADVHVNADALNTFYQSLSDADRASIDQKMPDLNKDIRDGLTTKADIPVNQADFHTYIQPMDTDGHLDEWTKLVPEHLSEGDMKAHDKFMQALFDTVEENNRSLRIRDAQDTQSSIYDQLIRFTGAGRTPSAMVDAAKMISENPAKFYDAMMARAGNRGDVADVLNRLIRDVQIKRMLPNMEPYMAKGEMDLRLDDLRNSKNEVTRKTEKGINTRKQKVPTPIMDYIGKLGGIRRGSQIAKEVAALGINKTDHPQVFNKFTPPDANQRGLGGIAAPEMDAAKYGLKDVDRLVASELENATGIHPQRADNSDYIDTNWLLDHLRAEAFKDSHMTDKDQEREDLSQMLDYLNLDVNKNSNIEIKRAIEVARAEQQKALNNNDGTTFDQGLGTEYNRVMPRDLFNEGKVLSMHLKLVDDYNKGLLPKGFELSADDSLGVGLTESGELYLEGVEASFNGEPVRLEVPYNAGKETKFPLHVTAEGMDAWSIPVYTENGTLDKDFTDLFGKEGGAPKQKIELNGTWKNAKNFMNQLGVVGLWETDRMLPRDFKFDLHEPDQGFKLDNGKGKISSVNLDASLGGKEVQFYMDTKDNILRFKQGRQDGLVLSGNRGMSDEFRSFLDKNSDESKTLYQGDVDKRGSITFTPEGGAVIRTFSGENLSTVLHEFGHLYWKAMTEIGKLENAPESVVKDIKTMRDWAGAKDGEDLSVAQEEKIADGFLDYLRKGEAPSVEMQGAFSRFKGWLVRLYSGVKDTLPQISAEVKDVFDRMFATDAEIEAVRSIPEFQPDPAIMGMLTKPEREKYQAKMVKQIAEAKERLFREAMRQSERENTALYKEQRDAIEKQVTEQVFSERGYSTINEILKAGGLSKKELTKLFGKEIIPYLKGHGGLVKDKGVDPAMIASMMGYGNSREMMDDLMNLKPKKERISQLTDDAMLARHGDMLHDGTIEGEALKAYHNNLKAELIHMEMSTAAKAAGIPAPSKEAIKARATQMLTDMKVKDIIPNRHYQAEIKAARAAGLAAGKKDYEGTARAKGQQLLNHYMYRMALDARDEIDKQMGIWSKILGRSDAKIKKAIDTDYVYAARYILARHGLGKTGYDFNAWLDHLRMENTEGNPNGDPEAYAAIQEAIGVARNINPEPYKMMSYTNFQALGDAVNNLIATGRDRSKIMIEGQKVELKEAVDAVSAALADRARSGVSSGLSGKLTSGDKAKLFVMSAQANWRRVEHWVQMIDQGNNGPVRKYIWNPIKRSVLQYRDERSTWMNRIMDVLEPERERLHGEKIPAPELMQDKKDIMGGSLPGDGEFYTFSDLGELHGMMLHLGNESNRFKLLKGRGWSEEGMDAFMRRMYAEGTVSKHDLDLRQKLWDMMEELKPRLWSAHKEMYGFRPEEVTAVPIQTPHGEYRGGYWPAIVDTDVSEDAQIRADINSVSNTGQTYAFPTAGRGALKSRVESYAGPLQMSMKLLPNHIDWALKFIHIEPAIKDTAKIIMNRDFRDAMRAVDPQATTDMLVPWLARTAKQITEVPSTGRFLRTVAGLARWARTSAGIQALGGNFANMGIHLTQLAPFTRELGGNRMAEALAAFMKNPGDMAEAQNELSLELRNRQQIGDINPMTEIGRILADQSQYDAVRKFDNNGLVKGIKTVQDFAHDNAYILQAIVWHMTDHVGWHAAYNKALEGEARGIEGGDSDKAVEYADSLIRRIQGSHNPEDISNIEMRSAWAKIFQFMYGWFNNMGNYTATEKDIIKNSNMTPAAKAASTMYLHLMTAVAVGFGAEVISGTVRGATPSQNDKYKREGSVALHWVEELGISLARWEGAKVPYLNTVVNAVISKYTDKNYSDHLAPSPLFDQIDTMLRMPGELYNAMHGHGNNATATADLLSTLGFITSTPISALKKPVKYLMKVNEGKEHPANGLEMVRGILGGPAPKK